MIVNLEETKQYLKIDDNESDVLLNSLINAAEKYLKNATGHEFDESNHLARIFCWILISDWYENREYIGKASDKIRPIIESMLAQLKYCYESEKETEE